jgi:hypothetical protein
MPPLLSATLLIAAAPAPVVAAPPIIRVESPPLPSEYRERMERQRVERELIQQRQRRSRATVAVEVSAGGQSLWSGTLRVGYPMGASVERSLTQALPVDCVVDENAGYRAGRNSFRLGLNNPQFPDRQVRMSFNVSWQRPAETCADAQFTRSVELSGSIQLDDGESVTVQGDAGLVAKFRLIKREIAAGSGDDPSPPVIHVD